MHNVTYGCTLVTHGASQRHGKSRASQSCTQLVGAIRFVAGRRRQDGSRLRRLTPTSIPISSTSQPAKTGRSHNGQQNRLHGEAFRRFSRTVAIIRQQERCIAQRHCDSGIGGFSPTEEEAWVNGHQVGTTRFSWNIGLIVCCRQSWNRFTSYWCPTSDGRFRKLRVRRN